MKLIALLVAVTGLLFAADSREQALDYFYNLDFDEALASFEKLSAASPNDAALHNHIAHTLLFRELLRNGALESQMVSGNNSFIRRMKMEPPPEMEKRFFVELDKSLAITQSALAKNPKDVTALQRQAVGYALRANFGFFVKKTWLSSLGDASKGYKAANQAVALEPNNADAKLLIGGYDYIVGSLTWHMRMLGSLAGFHGDRERGLRTMEIVARDGKMNKRDAQITLCALYRREGQTARAIPMLLELIDAYPRNYLLRFELAQMYGSIGERAKALAVLEDVRSRKEHNVAGYSRVLWEKIYYETGNLQFWFNDLDHALASLKRVTAGSEFKELDLSTGALAWVRQGQVLDLQNRHELAISAYKQAIQFAPEAEAAKEAQKYISNPYRRNAKG